MTSGGFCLQPWERMRSSSDGAAFPSLRSAEPGNTELNPGPSGSPAVVLSAPRDATGFTRPEPPRRPCPSVDFGFTFQPCGSERKNHVPDPGQREQLGNV